MCSEEFLRQIKAGKSYDEIQLLEIADRIKKAANSNMNQAGHVGSQVHDMIENYIHNKTIPEIHNDLMKKSFNKFKEWYDLQEGLELVFTETKVLSRIHKYTGTLDALFKKNNEYIIYDWKTSSGIRESYYVQLYLYVMALEEQLDIKINKGVIVNCTKQGKLNIAEFPINSEMQDVAISCLKLHRFLNNKKEK
jgi:ATP-dependent exoDNAse (exonuclease V) beta subunit